MIRLEPNTPFNVQCQLKNLNAHWTRCLGMKAEIDTEEPKHSKNYKSFFQVKRRTREKRLKKENRIFKSRIRRRVRDTNDYCKDVLSKTAVIMRAPKEFKRKLEKQDLKIRNSQFYKMIKRARSHYQDTNDEERHKFQKHLIKNINFNRKVIAFDYAKNSETYKFMNKIRTLKNTLVELKKNEADLGDFKDKSMHKKQLPDDFFRSSKIRTQSADATSTAKKKKRRIKINKGKRKRRERASWGSFRFGDSLVF